MTLYQQVAPSGVIYTRENAGRPAYYEEKKKKFKLRKLIERMHAIDLI
jgi:hypothetical protein